MFSLRGRGYGAMRPSRGKRKHPARWDTPLTRRLRTIRWGKRVGSAPRPKCWNARPISLFPKQRSMPTAWMCSWAAICSIRSSRRAIRRASSASRFWGFTARAPRWRSRCCWAQCSSTAALRIRRSAQPVRTFPRRSGSIAFRWSWAISARPRRNGRSRARARRCWDGKARSRSASNRSRSAAYGI